MDINDVYLRFKYLANKSGYSSFISPQEFNLIFNSAELKFFNNKYAAYGTTKRIDDTLSKVKTAPTVISIDGAGKYTFPVDMLHESSITATFNGTQVEVTEWMDDRLGNKLSSSYDAPSTEFPIYVRYNTYLQFYPITLGAATLTYLKKPTAAKWNYTLVSGRPVYSSGTSVQPVWSDLDIDAITMLALQDFGINARDGEVENFAQTQSKQTV